MTTTTVSEEDKVLLFLAAQAANIDIYFGYGNRDGRFPINLDEEGGYTDTWNPLIDDDDAENLKLRLKITVLKQKDVTAMTTGEIFCKAVEPLGEDVNASVRRAIVRVAAHYANRMHPVSIQRPVEVFTRPREE